MAHITEDRVLETTTTTGTGALTLAGALTGFRTFASVMAASDTCWYYIEAVDGSGNATGDFEAGLGTYNTTLTRTTVVRSSNANAVVTLAAGTKRVGITLIAAGYRASQLDNELTMPLPAVTVTSVTAAVTDSLRFFARKVAGRMTPKYIGPSGVDKVFQDKLSEDGGCLYFPNNGTTAGLNLGIGWTTSGTVSHPTPSSTSPAIYSQQKRTRWANVVTTTNQTLGIRSATAEKTFWRGNAAGLGGFNFHARFAIGLWPAATVRLFVGLTSINTAMVASDTLSGHACGLWHDTTEAATVLSFMTRDGTTANETNITLATALAAGQCFDFWMWAAPNGSAIFYKLVEQNTGTTLVDSSTSTNLPGSTTFLGPELMMSNGTANITVTTTAFELARMSCASDN